MTGCTAVKHSCAGNLHLSSFPHSLLPPDAFCLGVYPPKYEAHWEPSLIQGTKYTHYSSQLAVFGLKQATLGCFPRLKIYRPFLVFSLVQAELKIFQNHPSD